MSFLRNASKYKHTIGALQKKELWYPDVKVNASTGDFNAITASANWIAVCWQSPGTIGILSLNEAGKRKAAEVPLIHAHSSTVTDLAFDPFDDNILATAGDEGTVKLWKIPQGLDTNITNSLVNLTGHKKRVDCIEFHPSAKNVLASGSSDKTVKIWDIEVGKDAISIDGKHDDVVCNVAWNFNGDLLATVSRDKKIRVIDVRANQVVQVGEGHQGVKPSRVLWTGENRLFTTGFSKTRERQIAFWDSTNLSKSLVMNNIDSSTGVLDCYFDNDTQILYLAGKGDGGIKAVEVEEKAPYYRDLNNVLSDVSQKSTALVPKRALDLMGTEITRILKLTANAVAPVSYSVPRKSKTEFQEDLYPPTRSNEPALSSKEWFGGETKPPKMTQLKAERNPNKFWYDDKDLSSTPSSSNQTTPSTSSSTSTSSSVSSPKPSTTTTSSSSSASTSSSTSSSTLASSTTSASTNDNTSSPSLSRNNEGTTSTGKYEAQSVQVVRQSKFRHIVGKGTKAEASYVNLRASPAGNNSVIRANPTYFSYPLAGVGGRVGIVALAKPGRQVDSMPCIECGSDCLDFDFSPFHDDMFATVTESAVVQIWKIPEGGLKTTIRTPEQTMKGHTRRVTTVEFHPVADNIVVSSAGDFTIRLWDIVKSQENIKLEGHTDAILGLSWNWDGSILATSSKDKDMRITDPRANKTVDKVEAHDGVKGFKLAWVGEKEQIATVGFSKGSNRQVALWDLRDLSKPLSKKEIDNGAGIMTPYYDADTGVLFLSGKGDGNIKMYEFENNEIHHLTDYNSNSPTLGLTLLPKFTNNVRNCEIAHFLKLNAADTVEPLHFSVPRTRAEFFQDDLFPKTRKTNEPALDSAAWFSGETKPLPLMDLRPSGMPILSENPIEKREKKYDFNEERTKDENTFSKDKFLDKYYETMGAAKEEGGQVLKQDLMEGVADDEWD